MIDDKARGAAAPRSRATATRDRVLAAAERLLRAGDEGFSMRDLAAEAGVSFATPFNQFGDKAAIMRALSARRIAAMSARYAEAPRGADAATRVLAATAIAVSVMLEEPAINRAVMGSLGSASVHAAQVLALSRGLWAQAIDGGDSFAADLRALAVASLPDQLALAFRGALSFWTAGEIGDDELPRRARAAAATLLLGFARPRDRVMLLGEIAPES